jgi:hypothetical protein
MRKKGDYLDTSTLKGQDLADPSSLYMAVYPQNGFVAFTLKFAGPGGPYVMNIKQALKNKVLNRNAGVHLSPGRTFTSHFDKDSYEDLTRNKPFIWLP